MAHAAFIVPIALSLYRVGVDPIRLAADSQLLKGMVRATAQAFRALRASGNREVPRNLRALYLAAPEPIALGYWRRTLRGPNGELWFAAHTRAAPEEIHSLATALLDVIDRARVPELVALARG
jgi:2-dehydropantoate 2-reductase